MAKDYAWIWIGLAIVFAVMLAISSKQQSGAANSHSASNYSQSRTERLGEDHLRAALKDGESAKVVNATAHKSASDKGVLCGDVNSKNSFGAFTGFQRFISSENGAVVMVEGETGATGKINVFEQAWLRFCPGQY